jgi:hypothetical protein
MTNAAKVVSLKAVKAAVIAPSAAVVTLSHDEAIKLAQSIATNYNLSKSSGAAMAEACKKMFDAGIKVGKRAATKARGKTKAQPACELTAKFLAARFPTGLNTKGEPLAEKTLANCASYFKRAVETGEAYNENASKTKGESKNIMIAFPKTASGAEAASKIMAMIGKMQEANNQLADLAAFLIDAVKDAGFDPATAAADAEIDAE